MPTELPVQEKISGCPLCHKSECTHRAEYSPAFLQLAEQQGVEELLEGSSCPGQFENWEAGRRFIADALAKDGTILDVGCGNGFMLRCLQEWSGKNLEPYGVDVEPAFIAGAKQVFPEQAEHFFLQRDMAKTKLPETFDTVFWCVWDDLSFDLPPGQGMLQKIQSRVSPGGRLIFGLYDNDRRNIEKKLAQLREYFPTLQVKLSTVPERTEACAFVDL